MARPSGASQGLAMIFGILQLPSFPLDINHLEVLGERMRSAWGNVQNSSNVAYPDTTHRTSLPPTRWWRARSPHDFSRKDIRTIREFLLRHERVADCDWLGAVGGDPATAVGIAIKGLQRHGLKNPITDAVISAILCCALEGDPTAKMVLISALRRRAKFDSRCHMLRLHWLHIQL
ncbi:hypothetical protein [Bradyrhizobium sp. Bra64]|uniref:hypothetical protein n=1 Tax=Bradyrhizobium sp. Bra64 TaxID=2926009 RepID=UPI0021177070|nr:hypothetical protein [Bradyrhizobium sp. Bra64]